MKTEEKRAYPRLNLGIDDGYFGNFTCNGNDTLVAQIVNISAGGLNMAVPLKEAAKLENNKILLLVNIAGGANFSFLSHIKAEIRWIKKLDLPGHLFVGCQFIDLSAEGREQLIKFVDSERLSRGQYR